jgi:tetratricopeptide (TPR) repeat protein
LIYLRQKNYPAAIADYDAALAQQPGLASSLYMRGWARQAIGQNEAGAADMANARANRPPTSRINLPGMVSTRNRELKVGFTACPLGGSVAVKALHWGLVMAQTGQSGASTKIARLRGRGQRGTQAWQFRPRIPHGHWKTANFSTALRLTGITAPIVLDRNITA